MELFFFCLSEGLSGSPFVVSFPPVPEWGIFDYIVRGPIIQAPIVWKVTVEEWRSHLITREAHAMEEEGGRGPVWQ